MATAGSNITERDLIRKRGTAKSKFTHFRKYLDACRENGQIDQLTERTARFKADVDSFERAQEQLETIASDDDYVTYLNERHEFEELYFELIAKAETIARSRESSASQINAMQPGVSLDQHHVEPILISQSPLTINAESFVKLPTMHLPKFGGSYESWPGFSDALKSAVHDNPTFGDAQWLVYLKSCLVGRAAEKVESLETTAANYLVAWNILENYYNDPHVIINNRIRAFFELPSCSRSNVNSLGALTDSATKHYNALQALTQPFLEAFPIYAITSNLDEQTLLLWNERSQSTSKLPTMAQLLQFLQARRKVLETMKPDTTFEATKRPNTHLKLQKVTPNTHHNRTVAYPSQQSTQQAYCYLCKGKHYTQYCQQLTNIDVEQRIELIRKAGLCQNCLRSNHNVKACTAGSCKHCNENHHTVLHRDRNNYQHTVQPNVSALSANLESETLLSTAVIYIHDNEGRSHKCKALLDSGSQSHFITTQLATKLKLQQNEIDIPLFGINQSTSKISAMTRTTIASRVNKFSQSLTFLILPRITEIIPKQRISKSALKIPKNVSLADPSFNIPSEVDVLLGAEVFLKLLCVGQLSLANDTITLQKTKLGWILAGTSTAISKSGTRCHLVRDPLQAQLTKFWEIEEPPLTITLSEEERKAEEHFCTNTHRELKTGIYTVRLPFKQNGPILGNSYVVALRRLRALEKSLARKPEVREQYINFMREYSNLGHMSMTKNSSVDEGYYLPHHAILKETSITTKLRVVFDASAKSSNGCSLNDALLIGPRVQDELYALLIRFRSYTYVLTADIEKMYRQIAVHESDRTFQKILWREDPSEPIQTYTLNTVTYGTSAAPFLAIRTLQQLAADEAKYQLGARALREDFYVDDVLTGANSYDEAEKIRDQLITICSREGFNLRQWASNDGSLIDSLRDKADIAHLRLDLDETIKTLGIQWHPNHDIISYRVKEIMSTDRVTKRSVLSKIATLFDPLGLLGPIIVRAKILMQRLWKLNLEWDESVPQDIHTEWITYIQNLVLLRNIRIPRHSLIRGHKSIQLHGFCDASTQAYGACIYMRSSDQSGQVITRLISSKSRVAPLKTITLPRLELCAAHLLSKLYQATAAALRHLKIEKVIFWSDSTIALCWIQSAAHTLKTFVSHRVADIQSITGEYEWRHIRSDQNPADLISRGITTKEYVNSNLWHNGPLWLTDQEARWPKSCLEPVEIPELRPIISLPVQVINTSMFDRFSSFQRLTRVIAYILRFLGNTLRKEGTTGPLLPHELQVAERRVIWIIQRQSYAKEKKSLQRDVQATGNLAPLSPFLDEHGLLRVGGRLSRASLPYDSKHPILMPRNSIVTKLLIRDIHIKHYHTGIQATLNTIRHKYWIPNGKNLIRRIIHKCVVCHRAKPRQVDYCMGDLPQNRITFTRPFLCSGVDFCGPIFIKEKVIRNRNKIKVYLAVFVCFVTKAIHIEIVDDLTTDAFLAALRRFFARRGKSSDIYSDNATNFIGAKRELKELYALLHSQPHNDRIIEALANDNINWHTIPPRSPHFGGLWEADVKAVKHHIVRVIGETLLSYEGLLTYVTQIEAILNSRPLTSVSSDPNDITAITPSHFLIGETLTSIPDYDLTGLPAGRLSSWQHVQQLKQHFWKRWNNEYLQDLNVKKKWHTGEASQIAIGTMVIIREDNVPPMSWPLGRITEIHSGSDGTVRVVTVKTTSGEYKRCVKRISPLPINK